MKKYFNDAFPFCLVTLFFFFHTSMAMAAPPPLPDLMRQIALDFSRLEEAYREEKWDETQEELEKISHKHTKVLPDLLRAAKGKTNRKKVAQFGFIVKALKKQFTTKDRVKSAKSFYLFQDMILQFIDFFSYVKHPFLEAFGKELEKIIEQGELNFDEIEEEAEEMTGLVKRISTSLTSQGIPQRKVRAFLKLLENMEQAASAKNKAETLKELKAIQKLNDEILGIHR